MLDDSGAPDSVLASEPSDTDVVFPTLDRIDAPHGALAAAQQRKGRMSIEWPRGFHQRHNSYGLPKLAWMPVYDSAMWFKQMHHAYRAANFANFAILPIDLAAFVVAENAELGCAAAHPHATHGPDGSLKPRMVAVWVGVSSTIGASCLGDRVLDAISHWSLYRPGGATARPIASTVRLTALAGADTADFLRRVANEHTRPPAAPPHDGSYGVTVRWVDQLSKRLRSETHVSNFMPVSSDAMLADIQQTVIRLVGLYDAPFPTTLMRQVLTRVPDGAYPRGVDMVCEAFHNVTSGTPSVTLDRAASSGQTGPLENTGVVVRLCEKDLKEKGLTHPRSFHGALLCFGAAKSTAVAFTREGTATANGLRVPLGLQEESMGLHVCAVQAELSPLWDGVTLFGKMGRPGEEINPPGSSVWVESAAIRPVDSGLLGSFALYPCAKASLIPGNPALAEPFKRFFMRASTLYTSLDSKNRTTLRKTPTFSSSDELEACDAYLGPSCRRLDADEMRNERFMLAAFRVDLHSSRTTIGDAYAYLFDVGAPPGLVSMLMHGAGVLGVSASLSSTIDLCRKHLKNNCTNSRNAEPNVAECDKLRRLVSVAIDALVDADFGSPAKGAKRAKSIPIASSERIRRLILSMGLKREANSVAIGRPVGLDVAQRAVQRIGSALHRSTYNDAPPLAATQLVYKMANNATLEADDAWAECVAQATFDAARSMLLELRARNAEPVCFAIQARVGSSEVRIHRITIESGACGSSLDAMIAEKEPGVFIVQQLDNFKLRVTATIPLTSTPPRPTA